MTEDVPATQFLTHQPFQLRRRRVGTIVMPLSADHFQVESPTLQVALMPVSVSKERVNGAARAARAAAGVVRGRRIFRGLARIAEPGVKGEDRPGRVGQALPRAKLSASPKRGLVRLDQFASRFDICDDAQQVFAISGRTEQIIGFILCQRGHARVSNIAFGKQSVLAS